MEKFQLSHDVIEIEVWSLGARLNSAYFAGSDNLLVGATTIEEALGPKKYNGAVVGPVANRIADGCCLIDGVVYQLPKNENGSTTLHSGPEGLHMREWEMQSSSESHMQFICHLEDGECGLPGRRVFSVQYRLIGPDTLCVTFDCAVLDGNTSLINPALHPYWCLDCREREDLKISVSADQYLPIDAAKLPTGDISSVEGTKFDLRELRVPSDQIDHNYCFDRSKTAEGRRIVLEGRAIRLDIETEASGVQIYTGKSSGIAIEPQEWPDAPHHSHFPSIEFDAGGFRQSTIYRFSLI